MQRGKTVLLVEDDPDIADTMADVLRESGYTVHCAADGREALGLLARIPRPGLILLDLMMPSMDGYAFRQQQQRDPRVADIPVVVMTACRPTENQIAGELDCAAWIHKPFALKELIALVARLCRPTPTNAAAAGR